MTKAADENVNINGKNSLNTDRLEVLRKDGRLTLTDAQKQAVLTKGRVLVSAAAGSGKTSTMVKRIMLMIAEGHSMRNMLVLVYNTAAADELKERLHGELFDRACCETGEARERFRKELDDLPFCHICTIHSFCNSLIRDNFDKLGISPAFEVLDEQAHAVYMNDALDNVFDACTENNDEIFSDIAEIFSQARREDNLKSNIIRLHGLIDVQPDRQQFFDNVTKCFSDPEEGEFVKILEKYYKSFFEDALEKLEEAFKMLSVTALKKHTEALRISIVVCKEQLAAANLKEMLNIALTAEKPSLIGESRKQTEFEQEIKTVAKSYRDDVFKAVDDMTKLKDIIDNLEVRHAQNAVYIDKIIQLTLLFDKELTKLKQADNVLSFEDLQHRAAELLTEYPDLGCEYDAVFVDEYQDVNPTQEFIIQRLVKGECFMVGDVKQSIYGFRLADPKIFLSRQERYKSGEGTAIDFNRNFRSVRKILAFVNGVFNAVMTMKSADVDYKNTAAFELDGAPEGGNVQIHLFEDKKAETDEASGLYDITNHVQAEEGVSASRSEGSFIAREIKSLVGRAKKDDGSYIGFGDIAVLFRSRSRGAQQILEQLKAEGIPIDESVFGKSSSRPERELISMLRVLDNPRQDIPLAGFLLSFFGGYSESELALIAAKQGDCLYDKVMEFAGCTENMDNKNDGENGNTNDCSEYSIDDVCRQKTALARKLRGTLAMLDAYRTKASFKNVSELMSGIVADFCYDAYLTREGDAEVYGLKTFIAGAAQNDCSFGKFLDGYSENVDSRISAGGGERVHISTFHGFKGLEIPVTFVADTAYGFNRESGSGDLSALGKGYIGLKYFDFEQKLKFDTLSKFAVAKLAEEQRIKEEMRLFYVALTRAKQMLYVTASVSASAKEKFLSAERQNILSAEKLGGAECDLDFIATAICRHSADVPVYYQSADETALCPSTFANTVLSSDGWIVEAVRRGRGYAYPHKVSTRLAMKYSVSAIDSMDDRAVRVFEEGASEGTAYHKVMQYIDLFVRGEEGAASELDRLVGEGILSEEERSLIDASLIAACLDSEIIGLAREAQLDGRCMREKPFMMYKEANELRDDFKTNDKVLVQGVVDLLILGKQNVLVDFKCSRLDDGKLVEKYKTQLYLYKTAVESALCKKVDRVLIYSFYGKHAIDCL